MSAAYLEAKPRIQTLGKPSCPQPEGTAYSVIVIQLLIVFGALLFGGLAVLVLAVLGADLELL